MKANELGDWIRDEERGVSPVIGVILMVAITVILAAVIAAFVLDLGQSQGANAQAGLAIEDDGEYVESVQINNIQRLDSIEIQTCGNSSAIDNDWPTTSATGVTDNPSAGDEVTFVDGNCGVNELTVVGTYDGSETVLN